MGYYKSRVKLNIPPGLTGLVLLVPVLFLFYGYSGNVFIEQYYMPLAMPDKTQNKYPFNIEFSVDNCRVIKRDFFEFDLNGNESHDKDNLRLAQLKVKQLVLFKDTLAGVKINFGKKCKYDSFIKAIDICNIERPYLFYILDDSLYIMNRSQSEDKKADSIRCLYPYLGRRMDCAGVK